MISKKIIKGVGDVETLRGCSCEMHPPASGGIPVVLIKNSSGEDDSTHWMESRLKIDNLDELFIEIDYIRNAKGPMLIPFGFVIEDQMNDHKIGIHLFTQDNESNPGVIESYEGFNNEIETQEQPTVITTSPTIRMRIPYDGSTGYVEKYGNQYFGPPAIAGPYRIYAKVSQLSPGQEVKYINW